MATAEQIKSLIKSHMTGQPEAFYTVALQLAAHEARQGHQALAEEIRGLVDTARTRKNGAIALSPELANLVLKSDPDARLGQLVLGDDLKERIERIRLEFRQQAKLKAHGLSHRRKILLVGPPGTGKTLTASVLAGELALPLYTVLMERLVTKFMGETSVKLRLIFDLIAQRPGIYLFDEFDAIGTERSRDNDVGEMRRVLNSFLQFIERDESNSLIIAATNNAQMLDHALFRRFDDILRYTIPGKTEIEQLMRNRLGNFSRKGMSLTRVAEVTQGLSHAEVAQACDDAIKDAILGDRKYITASQLKSTIDQRKKAYISNTGS
ncbi:MAG: ATP-binding protein [Candidatus Sumerlaeia bacterium]|nr:ATP-binding protein [Candidatus Sumerlaeia bacterium]